VSASPETPLIGHCGCGAVRFEVRAPFESAGYCHCHRCQHRTGTAGGASARVPRAAVEFTDGLDLIRTWKPEGGKPKSYCGECGGHLFAGALDGEIIAIRMGAIEGDPGIRPEFHQWVSSFPVWENLPDDGLPRHPENSPA
jgi:hypothetical protein